MSLLESITATVPQTCNIRFDMGVEDFRVSVSTKYLSLERRKTRFEIVLHILSVCESQRSVLIVVTRRALSVPFFLVLG